MNQKLPTNYDEVPYPGSVHVQTHPDRLAVIATLLGLESAPVQRCRVLELGCGDGTNVLAMAHSLPHSEFLGIDGAARPIAEGKQMIADLGLSNIRLEQRDLLKIGADLGTFDYIITHGVYSWVPAPVRDCIMRICAECLAPNGVAYISYNAYPGCHLRDMVRRMMLFHVRDIDDPMQRVAQGRSLLQFLATAKSEPDRYQLMFQAEIGRPKSYGDGLFYHDDLNPMNQPFYFHEFIAHAAQHGLKFLSEAALDGFDPSQYTPATIATLDQLEGDPIVREQYLDFLTCRRFRRTLLCRSEIALDYQIRCDAIADFFIASEAEPVSPEPDVESKLPETFRTPTGASIETNHPVLKAALLHLHQHWPEAIPFADLLAVARRRPASAGSEIEGEQADARMLHDLLLRTYLVGVIELHAWKPPFVSHVSERPIASVFARFENRRKNTVPTLRHNGLEMKDSLSRYLLGLLDGTRDSTALVEAMLAFVQSGQAELMNESRPVTDPADLRTDLEKGLPAALKVFARSALLVA